MSVTLSKVLKAKQLLEESKPIPTDQSVHYVRHSVSAPDVVNAVSLNSDKFGNHLLIFESICKVFVAKLFLSDEKYDSDFNYELIQDFIIGVKSTAISLSPETQLNAINSCLKLAVATHHLDIRILQSDLNSAEPVVNVSYLRQHSDFINDIAFEPITGQTLASVSDDCSCCLWSITDDGARLDAQLTLTSAGVSVKWHNSDPNKLFIAEKKGIIRFYNCQTKRPVMSCDCNQYPLMSADWSPTNSLSICCVAGSDIFFWDTSLSSLPIERRKAHPNGSQSIRFYDSNIVATRGRPNSSVRVLSIRTNQVLMDESLKAGAGIAWDSSTPMLAVGANKAVQVYRFPTTH